MVPLDSAEHMSLDYRIKNAHHMRYDATHSRLYGGTSRGGFALSFYKRKGFDVSLFDVASSMGVEQSDLEKLLAGQASVGIARKLGVIRMDLQRFIAGDVSMSMALALGMLKPQAQELRDQLGPEGAIGIIVGRLTKAP